MAASSLANQAYEALIQAASAVSSAAQGLGVNMTGKFAGEDLVNDLLKTETQVTYTNLTADTAVKSTAGRLFGFIVNSHTSGTLKIWDNTAGSGTVLLNTITFPAGSGLNYVFPVGINFSTGAYFDIGGTIDLTALTK